MTAPNQIAPMPEPGGAPAHPGPKFETPKPTTGQRLSMRLAGTALGLGRNASPEDTLKTLVTQVGGYTPNDFGGKQTTTFVKQPEKALYRNTLRDETVRGHSTQREYAGAADYTQETSGLFLTHAAERVTSGQEARSGHLKLREKAARALVGRATRGGRYSGLKPTDSN